MKCVFRVDASIDMGTGHVMRCRTLANALKIRGADIHFITRAHQGHLGDMLASDGFSVTLLPQPDNSGIKGLGYAALLGVSQQEDALQTIQALEGQVFDWLIVDHYGLDQTWEEQLRLHASKLMAIDDLANRNHICDALLDQNYAVEGESRYSHRVQGRCQFLLGPRYALIRPEYAQYLAAMAKRSGHIKRVLVFMGGSDNLNITGKVLDALCADRLAHIEVDVVIGANFIHKYRVNEQANSRPNTRIHGPRSHLADLMAKADLAVGAGGATTWERFCMGLPSLVISIAENQVPTCMALESTGLIKYLGDAHDLKVSAVELALVNLLNETVLLRRLADSNKALVDGLGASRVAEVLMPTQSEDLTLRYAKETESLIFFDWVNDPVVRSSAYNSELIDLVTHIHWFNDRLNNKNCFLYILEANGLPIGQVRFDFNGEEATIDYSLDVLVRGRGWASKLLRLGIEAINKSRPTLLNAFVKQDNIASLATFISLGFLEKDMKTGVGMHFQLHSSQFLAANSLSKIFNLSH
jgi:UDP-2,4-diacetamido-2,4,6-trideoxy-beta-L-altropyranose hydrolase